MPSRSGGTKVKVSDATQTQLETYVKDIERRLNSLSASDSAEKEELKRRLDEAEGWISDRKKADADRDKVKDDNTTIVVPPSTVAPSDRQETRSTSDAPSGSEQRKGGWKRWV